MTSGVKCKKDAKIPPTENEHEVNLTGLYACSLRTNFQSENEHRVFYSEGKLTLNP